MKLLVLFLASLLAAAAALCAAADVQFQATNNAAGTPGGDRFASEIGIDYTVQVLSSASSFIWSTFQQSSAADRKDVQLVTASVDTFSSAESGVVAYTVDSAIHVSAGYIAGYSGDVKTEITGVLYHETTHVWQWDGAGAAPGGLIEGIADFVRLRAGYAPAHWVKAGEGDRWDQGYDVTARFLDYCDGLKPGFVAQLNADMKNGYSDGFFVQLLGKSVDQLWSDYKAMYAAN